MVGVTHDDASAVHVLTAPPHPLGIAGIQHRATTIRVAGSKRVFRGDESCNDSRDIAAGQLAAEPI